jgi:thiol-disulfide isomerase/thioredoxin
MKSLFVILFNLAFIIALQAQDLRKLKGIAFPDEVLQSGLYKTNEEKTTLGEVLSELKGNAVLIDFWASWCKTCAREMEYSIDLEKKYEGKPIVFLFLSTDTDYKQWLLGLARINVPGKHYRIDEASKKNIKEFLKIKGIPYYVLLDKESYIFDPKASWPHLEKLENEINLLLSL